MDYEVATLPEYGIAIRFIPAKVGVYRNSEGEVVVQKRYRKLLEYRYSPVDESPEEALTPRVDLINFKSNLWHESTWNVVDSVFHGQVDRPITDINQAPLDGFEFTFEHEGSYHTTCFFGPKWFFDPPAMQIALLSCMDWTATWKLETHRQYYSRMEKEAKQLRPVRRPFSHWDELSRPGDIDYIGDVEPWVFLQYGIAPKGYLIHEGVLYWIPSGYLYDPKAYHQSLMAFDGDRAVELLDAQDVPMYFGTLSQRVERDVGYLYACAGRGDGCCAAEGIFLDLRNGTYVGIDDQLEWSDYYEHDFPTFRGHHKIMYADEYYFGLRDGLLIGRWAEWDRDSKKVRLAYKLISFDGHSTQILHDAYVAGRGEEMVGDRIKLNRDGDVVYYGGLWTESENTWEFVQQDRSSGTVSSRCRIRSEDVGIGQVNHGIDPRFPDRFSTPWHNQFREATPTTPYLRVLTEPSLNGRIITTIGEETVIVLDETPDMEQIDGLEAPWALIRTGEGIRGWCFIGYLSKRPLD